MNKIKRLLTEDEMDTFLKLRDESNIKAAKYMKSLEHDLFEVTEEAYDPKRINSRSKRSGNIKVAED